MQCETMTPEVGATVDSCPQAARWRRRVLGVADYKVVEWTCELVGRTWELQRGLAYVEVGVGRARQAMPFAEGDERQALAWAWRWLEQHGSPARPEGWAS